MSISAIQFAINVGVSAPQATQTNQATQVTQANQPHRVPDLRTNFGALPIENRFMIWSLVDSKPRVIWAYQAQRVTLETKEIQEIGDVTVQTIIRSTRLAPGGFKTKSAVPPAMKICKESRMVALKRTQKRLIQGSLNPSSMINTAADVLFFENPIDFELFSNIKRPDPYPKGADPAAATAWETINVDVVANRTELEKAIHGIDLSVVEGLYGTLKHMVIDVEQNFRRSRMKRVDLANCIKWTSLESLTVWDRQDSTTTETQGKKEILATWAELYKDKDVKDVPKLLFAAAYKRKQLKKGDAARLIYDTAKLGTTL